jgi:hypothetical protein
MQQLHSRYYEREWVGVVEDVNRMKTNGVFIRTLYTGEISY